ncbi:MAG: FliM/FliN family flagellar motor switch protein [Gammaproteobacteria bacterium]|nr:FliM/FliN family flagellar motor switch protein [Gammaproteobacteria bacterium]
MQARAAISDEEVSALLEKGGSASGPRPFDLSTRRISHTELPVLDQVCKAFAERASTGLAAMVNRAVGVRFEGVQRTKAVDVLATLPSPSAIAVLAGKPLAGESFLGVEPSLLLALLDGFFGGSGRVIADPQAAIAPAAQRFLGLTARSLAVELKAAWQQAAPVEFEFARIESNPRLLDFGDPLDSVLVARFGVEFAAHAGSLHWYVPEAALAPVRAALAADSGRTPAPGGVPWTPVIAAALQVADLETRAILAEARISLGELVRLAPGDVIPVDAPSQVRLLAGDVPLYQGRFGLSRGRNAIKIVSRGPA